MTAQPREPGWDMSRSTRSRWESFPGGPLVGIILGIGFSVVCWLLAVAVFARFIG